MTEPCTGSDAGLTLTSLLVVPGIPDTSPPVTKHVPPMEIDMTLAGPPAYPHHAPHGRPVPPPPPRPPSRPKRTLRKVLLTLLGLAILLVAAAMVFGRGTAPTRNATDGKTEQPGTLSVLDLQVGDCYNSKELPPAPGSSQPVSTVEVVPCTAAHTEQVIDKISYKATDDFADVRGTRSSADCEKAFVAKLPRSVLEDRQFQLGRISPSDQVTWFRHPVIACVVVHPSSTASLLT